MRMAVVAAAAALIASATTAGAFFTFDWPVFDSFQFRISAYGWDVRVYEWRSPTDPDVLCSTAFAENGGPIGMQCWTSDAELQPNSD